MNPDTLSRNLGRDEQRRHARRTAFVLGCFALAMYAGFIWMSVHRAHG